MIIRSLGNSQRIVLLALEEKGMVLVCGGNKKRMMNFSCQDEILLSYQEKTSKFDNIFHVVMYF